MYCKFLDLAAEELIRSIISGEETGDDIENKSLLCKRLIDRTGARERSIAFTKNLRDLRPSNVIFSMMYMDSLVRGEFGWGSGRGPS